MAFINVYYKNKKPDFEKSFRDFKLFAAEYPSDARIGEVRSWIRLLRVVLALDTDLKRSSTQLELVKNTEAQTARGRIDSLSFLVRNAYERREKVRDSLVRVNKELENFIIDLENKYQEVGQ